MDTIDDDAKFEAGEGGDEDGEAEPMDFDEKATEPIAAWLAPHEGWHSCAGVGR